MHHRGPASVTTSRAVRSDRRTVQIAQILRSSQCFHKTAQASLKSNRSSRTLSIFFQNSPQILLKLTLSSSLIISQKKPRIFTKWTHRPILLFISLKNKPFCSRN
jgi:hypothetical protein